MFALIFRMKIQKKKEKQTTHHFCL